MPGKRIRDHFEQSIATKQLCLQTLVPKLLQAGEKLVAALQKGGKVLTCGNGGSASDALHFAAELINGFERKRKSLAALALNADVSTLTAISNDDHYRFVFSKQIEAYAKPEDILVVLTTSGNSQNIIEAIQTARALDVRVIAFTGKGGGAIRERDLLGREDVELCVPSLSVPRIQENHIFMIHCLCDYIDEVLFPYPHHFSHTHTIEESVA